MIKKIHLWWLKKRAKRAYVNYELEMGKFDGGMELADYLKSARATRYRDTFEKAWQKIKVLDPSAPNVRLR